MLTERSTRQLRLALAWAVVTLILIQAVIAGRSDRLFGTWNIGVHGVIGNIVFPLVVLNMILLALRRAGRAALITAVVLVALVVAQTGLGYTGRTNISAAAWHIPTGVAAFGFSVWNLALAWLPDRRNI
ncbi:MAG: hypothetical protein ACKV2O_06700 [Acidimicrobiales bacterium]